MLLEHELIDECLHSDGTWTNCSFEVVLCFRKEGHIIFQSSVIWISKNLVACQLGTNILHGLVTFFLTRFSINNKSSLKSLVSMS